MDKLSKIQSVIESLQVTQRKISNNKRNIEGTTMFDEEVEIYRQTFYRDSVEIEDVLYCIEALKTYKESCSEDIVYNFYHDLLINPDRLVNINIDECSISITTEDVPEPYEYYDSPETTITIAGYVHWTEEAQEQYRLGVQEELRGLEDKEKALVEELQELGVNIF